MKSIEPYATLSAVERAFGHDEARRRAGWAILHDQVARCFDLPRDVFYRHLLGVFGELAACKIFRMPYEQVVTHGPRPSHDLIFPNGLRVELKTKSANFYYGYPDIEVPIKETADILIVVHVEPGAWKTGGPFHIHGWAWSQDFRTLENYDDDRRSYVFSLLDAMVQRTLRSVSWDEKAFPELVDILNHSRPEIIPIPPGAF